MLNGGAVTIDNLHELAGDTKSSASGTDFRATTVLEDVQ